MAIQAMDANGNTVVAWQQSNGSNSQIFKSEYRSGEWLHPSGLTDNISPDGQEATLPQVAIGYYGSAIITWVQTYNGYQRVFKSEYR